MTAATYREGGASVVCIKMDSSEILCAVLKTYASCSYAIGAVAIYIVVDGRSKRATQRRPICRSKREERKILDSSYIDHYGSSSTAVCTLFILLRLLLEILFVQTVF